PSSAPSEADALERTASGPARMTAAPRTASAPKSARVAPEPAAEVKRSRLFDVSIEPRRLPSLRQALRSERITAVAPAKLFEAPAALVDALDRGRKVLVIGHVPPDGDCVGSALGLARMIRALGREAHVCIDDVIPGNLRKLANEPGELKRANELHEDYDLVVVVDVAAVDRIGGAAKAVARAPAVAVIDHHQVAASREDLALDAKTPLTTWVMPNVDSASLLVASAIDALAKKSPKIAIDDATRANIHLPLAAGTFTDTDGFARPGASMAALQGYKHLVTEELKGAADAVTKALDYELPKIATEVLAGHIGKRARTLSKSAPAIAAELVALSKQGVRLTADIERDGSIALIGAPRPVLELALRAARTQDPATSMNDVRGHLLNRLDRLPSSHALAALLFETEKGDVLVSTRSPEPGPALDLAQAVARSLGGNGAGHLRMAGARPPAPLARTEPVVRDWLHRFRLAREVKLKSAGNA
ncbi:DHH family phosphoesterase, partial [Myxococcota bacterium]|nr:DHH family phosphoesterase [Myxococcota bacterium]